MIREELEFRIARYADGDLTPAERLAVEGELADDAEARGLLAEYQTLRSAIEEAAGPALPKVHWDRLEQLLSNAVANAAPGTGDKSVDASEEGDGPFAETLGIDQEFAIACKANGSLSPERRPEVEQLLASDKRARALLAEYHNLDAATKTLAYSDPPPAIRWGRLANHISDVIEAGANARLPEDIERQIAAFVEGALRTDECDAVEDRLAADPAARVLASEYRNLDAALRAMRSAAPIPDVGWDGFASRISAAIDTQAVQTAVRPRQSREDGYSILRWLRSPAKLALAASVLLGVALVTRLMHSGPAGQPNPSTISLKPAPVEEVAVLNPEQQAGASLSEISIGPPAVARANDMDDDYAAEMGDEDDVVARPPRAFVASGRATPNGVEVLPGTPF